MKIAVHVLPRARSSTASVGDISQPIVKVVDVTPTTTIGEVKNLCIEALSTDERVKLLFGSSSESTPIEEMTDSEIIQLICIIFQGELCDDDERSMADFGLNKAFIKMVRNHGILGLRNCQFYSPLFNGANIR